MLLISVRKRKSPGVVVSQKRADDEDSKEEAHDSAGQYDDVVVARVDGVPVVMREQDMLPDYMAVRFFRINGHYLSTQDFMYDAWVMRLVH